MKKTILIIAAHPDDELLGCGGSIIKWVGNKSLVKVIYLSEGVTARKSLTENKNWETEILAREAMAEKYAIASGIEIIKFMRKPNLKTRELSMLEIVKEIAGLITKIEPTEIYTHFPGDLNSDHRICFEAVVTACRPFMGIKVKSIYSFEVPSSTTWSSGLNQPVFKPNHYIEIDEQIEEKLNMLNFYEYEMRNFPHPRSAENIKALAQIRGSDIGSKYAEAFMLVRSID
jgi:LmbE family N-acetylglucosaminyl deacetylase